ncbi:MAG: oligosaccharide flippase family protein, partial [Actinomycetota bacterium]|nr:oligosaccharide flippase family protein [Actinomycetota bacterium]
MATTADGGLTREQIRGSVLLLSGQVISTLVGSAVIQVLLVRHLSKTEYGAFAYALSVAILLEGFSSLGLSRAVARFIPIYDEEEDYPNVFGGLVLAIGATLGLGLAAVLLVNGIRGFIEGTLVNDTLAVSLLVILICLAPITALENVLDKTIVIFCSVRALFFRKYVLTPSLRLLVVVVLVVGDAGIQFLAFGYVAAGLIGLAAYGWILWRALYRRGLLQHFRLRGLTFPVREMLAFALPLLTTDLVFTVMTSSDAVMLGYFGEVEEVAALRAVVPFARLNQFVLLSFGLLFVPVASRLYARGDRAGINDLYWQSAAWIAVLSFPLFAMTSALASPLTILLLGERYADSASLLAVLAVGYYFHATLGFNGMVLSVFKKVRYIVCIDLLAAMVN